jgi:DNA-binding NarL/FixJ family response regulator
VAAACSVGLICADELGERIQTILAAAGHEIESSEGFVDVGSKSDAVVVAAIAGNGTNTATKVKALRSRVGDVPLVAVIPSGGGQQECRAAISAGADGVVHEADLVGTLAATIAATAASQVTFPAGLLRTQAPPSFSRREKQVLGMVVLGFTNQEIAIKLGLAESTIKSHLTSAFGKFGVSSRAEATALFLDTAGGLGLDVLEIKPG